MITLGSIFLLGSVLRILYTFVTPIEVRGHDYDGHLAYINHVLTHWTIPAAADNMQFYHPPLYYFFTAGLADMLGIEEGSTALSSLIQWEAAAFSIVTLLIGIWICRMLFSWRKEPISLVLSSLCIAVFPSLIFIAPRVNNDVLYQVFAFLSLGLLIRWMQKHDLRMLLLLGLTLGLGMITKSNSIVLALLALACIAVQRYRTPLVFVRDIASFLGLIIVVCAWLPAYRLREAHDGKEMIVGNYQQLTNFVARDAVQLLSFRPTALLREPYNDPFSQDPQRQYFWEYLYRSALTGEFHFGETAKPYVLLMLMFSLLLLPFVMLEIGHDAVRRRWELAPLWGGFLLILAVHVVFRISFPYSSSQDFRYSLPLIPLVAYYAVRTPMIWKQSVLTRRLLSAGFVVACTGFLMTVSMA